MTTPTDRIVEALRSSLSENERLRRQNRQLAAASTEPIAIIAMACRYPGAVDSPEALWRLVAEGRDAITALPADRGWDLDLIARPPLGGPDTAANSGSSVGTGPGTPPEGPQGGFVYEAGHFDPAFFGISPREALAMDPQQRLLLETSWEVFERARIDPSTLKGSRTGVYAGASHSGYGDGARELPEGVAAYSVTGISSSVLSGRLSYTYGFEGPAVTVDTACSSSLVALHLAAQALRAGECSLALVGGAAVMSIPAPFLGFSGVGVMAADSRCKAFAAGADGTGFAEGVGMLLVERLSDARRLGHRVLAVVRGTAVNQDGASSGLTAPNGPSQQRVIHAALANARLTAADVDAVEAHGTGTVLGDPIEAQALLATYGRERPADRPLRLGSIKSNLGHTQAAAGVAGVIKMVMALRHELLPRTLHVDAPTPLVDWAAGAVSVLTEQAAWPRGEQPRRAGVSSFGISGTNAHVIVEEAPADALTDPAAEGQGAPDQSSDAQTAAETEPPAPALGTGAVPWLVSGRGEAGMRAQAARLATHVRTHPELDPHAVGLSLAVTRAAHEQRGAVVAADRDGLLAALDALASGEPAARAVTGTAEARRRAVFVFPGQGSQWAGMAAGLLASSPVFADSIAACEAALAPYVEWTVSDVLREQPGAPGLDRLEVLQPVLWAVAVSLAALWRSCGVEPSAVVGHSQGEVAAAYVAGALSLEDSARLAALRCRTLLPLTGWSGMLSVALPAAEVEARIAAHGWQVTVAAINGPSATTLSGENGALDGVQEALTAEGIRTRRIPAAVASHSSHVEAIRDEVLATLAGITPRSGTIPFYSTVTGAVLDAAELDAEYWYRNLRHPVQFDSVVRQLLDDGFGLFIEASAHPVLAGSVSDIAEQAGVPAAAVGSLRRGDGGPDRFATSLAQAWAHGAAVDWRAVFPAATALVDLPTYAFQRQRYWLETTRTADHTVTAARSAENAVADDAAFWAAVEAEDTAALAGALELGADDEATAGLAPLLPALAAWRRGRRRHAQIDSWRYRIAWKPITVTAQPVLRGTWLLVAPENGDPELLHAYRQALAVHGADVLTIAVDPARSRRDGLAELLRAALPESFGPNDTTSNATASNVTVLSGVLSLLALDESPHPEHPALAAGLSGTVALVQALLDCGLGARLWCVTGGAVSAARSEHAASPIQAQAWGLGRVVALEQPELWGGLIDLPVAPDDRALTRLAAVLADPNGEDQLAVRPSGVFARRLVPAPLDGAPTARPWKPRGSVLITGGTGALGAHAARRLAAHGAQHLVLTSRRGRDAPGAAELEAELTALGARVTITACDLADRAAVAALLDAIPEQYPLTAVLHAAGVGLAATIDQLAGADLAATIAGKAAGAAHLDELLGDRPLDAFVLYSSNAAVWGSGGQAAYAAANAYLDALAERRRARGLTATSIAWGGWGGGRGMMAVDEVRDMLSRRGILEMEPGLAMDALVQAVEHDERFVSVAAIDWARFVPGFTARRPAPLLADLPAVRAAEQQARPAAPETESALTRRLAAAGPRDQERILSDLVRAHVASALGHDSPDAIAPTRPLRDLGFDSIVAVDLRNRLGAATGLKLPASLAFDHPTPAALARYLHRELVGGTIGGLDTTPAATAALPVPASAGFSATAADPAREQDDPIAIIGMACRLPGGIASPDELWQALAEGRDVVAEAPANRGWDGLDLARILAAPDQLTFLHEGGFIADAAAFDAPFFGISAEEATAMDPQQRLLLEMSWEALERGAVDATAVPGSRTGVFLGTFFQGYNYTNRQAPKATRPFLAGGSAPAIAAGRIASVLGLEGPTFTVDTGCSSSAVAIHLATSALRAGDCSLALAGGVTVMSHPVTFPSLGGGAAADGRCKSFSADADGTGWGEGAGMLLLERLSDALRNGHPVLALVRGTAVNHDGATTGLAAPSGASQERVIRAALADAGVGPAEVDAVEAHGTGTPLGDSVEAEALLATYGRDRAADARPLLVGTVKSNIGHPQAASGAIGVIKTVLSLRHSMLPRMLHSARPTPLVDWSAGGVELVTEDTPWPRDGRPRRAAVSSFGGNGTKVHLILEEPAPETAEVAPVTKSAPTPASTPWVVSGRSPEALRDQARRLAAHLRDNATATVGVADVAYSLAATRTTFDHRAVIVAEGREVLLAGLDTLGRGDPGPQVVTGETGDDRRVALVFPDTPDLPETSGAFTTSTARELYAAYPVYANAWDEACAHLDGHLDHSLRDTVFGGRAVSGEAGWWDPVLAEAATFAAQVALAALLKAWGVEPSAVAGTGTGAVAAVHAAGVLDLADAVALLTVRRDTRPGPAVGPADRLRRVIDTLRFTDPNVPIMSGSGGEFLTAEGLADPALWLPAHSAPASAPEPENASSAGNADGKLRAEGIGVILTVDPAALGTPAGLLTTLAAAFVQGAAVNWAAQFADTGATRVELPTYAFQRERYWLATGTTGSADAAAQSGTEGAQARGAVDDKTRKQLILEYFRRVNEGDVDRVLELFADDAVIEDPVGQDPRQGAESLREYYEITLEQAHTEVVVGKPTGAQDGSSVAIPVTGHLVALNDPEHRRVSIDCVDVFQVDGDGRIKQLRVYWGMTDYAF